MVLFIFNNNNFSIFLFLILKKGLPIERPQSITLDWIENKFSEKSKFEK